MSRDEENIKFFEQQIAHLKQGQAGLILENQNIEARILDLQGIEDQMAE